MSLSSDVVVGMVVGYLSQMKSRNQWSLTGYVVMNTAGNVSMTNLSWDYVKYSDTNMSIVFSGQFTISANDTLKTIYFKLSGGYNNYFYLEYQIDGSRDLTAGTYVIVARVDYVPKSLTVVAP